MAGNRPSGIVRGVIHSPTTEKHATKANYKKQKRSPALPGFFSPIRYSLGAGRLRSTRGSRCARSARSSRGTGGTRNRLRAVDVLREVGLAEGALLDLHAAKHLDGLAALRALHWAGGSISRSETHIALLFLETTAPIRYLIRAEPCTDYSSLIGECQRIELFHFATIFIVHRTRAAHDAQRR